MTLKVSLSREQIPQFYNFAKTKKGFQFLLKLGVCTLSAIGHFPGGVASRVNQLFMKVGLCMESPLDASQVTLSTRTNKVFKASVDLKHGISSAGLHKKVFGCFTQGKKCIQDFLELSQHSAIKGCQTIMVNTIDTLWTVGGCAHTALQTLGLILRQPLMKRSFPKQVTLLTREILPPIARKVFTLYASFSFFFLFKHIFELGKEYTYLSVYDVSKAQNNQERYQIAMQHGQTQKNLVLKTMRVITSLAYVALGIISLTYKTTPTFMVSCFLWGTVMGRLIERGANQILQVTPPSETAEI